ncbi:MAG: hypothetical protein K9G13_07025 [Aquiluna sp.]|nr:hypothetical protein [Aquiluna sp.]
MAHSSPPHRDRHGRGLRRPLPSKLFSFGIARSSFFKTVVDDTVEYLLQSFPEHFETLSYRIEEVPLISDGDSVKRWSANRTKLEITLYRIPIERFSKEKLPDPRMQIEHAVISAAASLVDLDPWDLIHPGR